MQHKTASKGSFGFHFDFLDKRFVIVLNVTMYLETIQTFNADFSVFFHP